MELKKRRHYPTVYPDLVWSEYLARDREVYTVLPRNGASFQIPQEHLRQRYPAIIGDLEASGDLRTTDDWVKLIRLMWKEGYRL